MSDILVNVVDQQMVITNTPVVASGGINEDRIVFTFDETWNNFSKSAIFFNNINGQIWKREIKMDGSVIVPAEVIDSMCKVFFGVIGLSGNIRKTTELCFYNIKQGALYKGVGNPIRVLSVAEMLDKTQIYLYCGSEEGYALGHWYYWNGNEWEDGGVYANITYQTDKTLTIAGMAADAKAAGDRLTLLENGGFQIKESFLMEQIANWLNEHPEATTTVLDGSLTEEKFANSLKIKAIKDYVTPEMFGAVGDGVADDTEALQNAIDDAFEKNVPVWLSKKYLIKDSIKIYGINSTYQKRGSVILGNGYAHIVAGADLTNILETFPKGDTRTYGIIVKDLILDGENRVTNGLYSEYSTSECFFENITINFCTNGVFINNNCYLNNFKAIRAYHCTTYGILFESGNNTSNVFEKCYVDTCANAYKINGQYSTMISCCADNITGIVFNLNSFTGSLIGCGSEATNFTTMFKVYTNSTIFIGGGMYFGNRNLAGYYFDIGGGCSVGVYNCILNYDSQQSAGSLCKLGSSARLTLKGCAKYYGFAGENSLISTSKLFDETAIKILDVSVTLNENNEAVISALDPTRYTILEVYSTNRTGWRFIPLRTGTQEQVIHVMSSGNWFPTISDKNFGLRITYVDRDLL